MNLKLILKNLFLSITLATACLFAPVRASTAELVLVWIAAFAFAFLSSTISCFVLIYKNIMDKDGREVYREPEPKRKRNSSCNDSEFEEYQLWKITRR